MINVHNKIFRSSSNSTSGEVSSETTFHYKQEGRVIYADYSGGDIIKGFLVGTIEQDCLIFVYQHVNAKHEIKTGKCTSYPEQLPNGKLRLLEKWEWTCGDFSKGESVIEEV